MKDELKALKATIPLADIVSEVVELKPAGRSHAGLCPFHSENTPSFHVYETRYRCYACGAKGDHVDFLMHAYECSFKEACERLRAHVAGGPLPTKPNVKPTPKANVGAINGILEANAAFIAQCHGALVRALTLHPKSTVAKYWTGRGFTLEDAERFKIGFCGSKPVVQGDAAYDAGILRRGRDGAAHSVFANRLTIPFRMAGGSIPGLNARDLTGEAKKRYINTTNTEAFQKSRLLYGFYEAQEAIKRAGECWLVEGCLDCVRMHSRGIANCCAINGTALSSEQLDLLPAGTHVMLCLDADMPGLMAAASIARNHWEILHSVCLLPSGNDPDDFLSCQTHITQANIKPNVTLIEAWRFVTPKVYVSGCELFESERFQSRVRKWVEQNIKDGYPQLNIIPWVITAFPELRDELDSAIRQMESEGLSDSSTRAFLAAWFKACRSLRELKAIRRPGGIKTLNELARQG